ncbi:MAG: hypothetical protein PHG02_04250 [Oscillospiraceae bacterium]|nr:hypothetical protein [Oscillospiraceae bacterium]
MDCKNSPVSFQQTKGWQKLTDYLDGKKKPDCTRAQKIFDNLLEAIKNAEYLSQVTDALLRRPPVTIPAYAYADETIAAPKCKVPSTDFRVSSSARLVFADGHNGCVDWCRYGGEEQPQRETLHLHLKAGDMVTYRIGRLSSAFLKVSLKAYGSGLMTVQQQQPTEAFNWHLFMKGETELQLACTYGEIWVEELYLQCEGNSHE